MTEKHAQAFATIRERNGLIAAALISALLWMMLIKLAISAAQAV